MSKPTGDAVAALPPAPATREAEAAVIWITGFSGAGKTTVGRKVQALLQESGVRSVFLDGDDLRSIFGGKWGYERADRIELAHAYFRLCNTLAAQGVTVVISAVAMYREIYDWVRTNVDRSVQVYLNVPEQERRARDKATKNIYSSIGDTARLYDEPDAPDMAINNYDGVSPDTAARTVVDGFRSKVRRAADKGRTAHWNEYYTGAKLVDAPSSFAQLVGKRLPAPQRLIEVGCGNGRDAAYFARTGHSVTALDVSSGAIDRCRRDHSDLGIRFVNAGLPAISGEEDGTYDVVYSRFVLHAMPEQEEIATLHAAARLLKSGGQIFIECRSINDPLARKGEVISPTERIHGHYRRFIVLDDLQRRLADAGFTITDAQEVSNVAALGDDNPVVLRVRGGTPGVRPA